MARAGDVIENKITGEKIVFKKTSSDTKGEYVEMEFFVRPGGFVAVEHIHLDQDESFEVLSGTITLSVDGQIRNEKQGFKYTVKRGTPHVWQNGGDEELHCRVILSPALEVEQFFEVLFGLVNDGRSNDKGLPNMTHMSLLAPKHNMWLPKPPLPMQKALFNTLKPFGVLLGYKSLHQNYIR